MRQPSTAAASSSQVPSSAPVLEFRCMFSHDVHKKQKKWHDGTAKYHTFNKKVMVYDESKNLVGGLHYRQPEEFGEGLEIKLDRPVLVQVEDQLGESTTDLTPLINRPGNNNSPRSNTQPVRPVVSRLPGPNSQVKPKSIKELLAGSQGYIGRSRFSTQSPFEQRHALNEIQINARPSESQDPPAKRQKLATKEASAAQYPSQIPTAQAPIPKHPRPPINSSFQDEPKVMREVMNISSDDEPVMVRNEARVAETKPKSPKRSKPSKEKSRTTEVSRDKAPSLSAVRSSQHSAAQPLSALTNSNARPSSAPSATKSSSFQASDLGPRSSLKFASQRSRPKLMYKALLLGTPAFSEGSSGEASQNCGSAAKDRSKPPARRAQNNLLETDEFFALSQLRRVPTPRSHEKSPEKSPESAVERLQRIPAGDENENENAQEIAPVVHSPLFLSQPDPQPTPSHNCNRDDDDNPDFFLDDIQNIPDSSPSGSVHEDEQEEPMEDRIEQEDDIRADSARSPTPVPTVMAKLARAHEPTPVSSRINKPLSAQALSSPIESLSIPMQHSERNFRRVFSESTATLHARDSQSDEDSSDDEAFFEIGQHGNNKSRTVELATKAINSGSLGPRNIDEQARILQTRVQGDNSLNRSDAAGIAPNEAETELQLETPTVETGPWTTKESFLLFDWWPRNKQKPDYGQGTNPVSGSVSAGIINDEYEDVSTSIASRGMSKKYGTFGSARFVSQR